MPDRTATLLPADTAGDVTYTITPALPAWLSFDPVSGTISGVGTATTVATGVYTITAAGKRGTLYEGAEANTAIAIEVAPTGAGHAGVTYAINPDLNAITGISFDTTDGTISGTPSTVAATATTYTVTATGKTGTIYAGYEVTVYIRITIT